MRQVPKRLRWVESSLDDLRRFPPQARQRAGRELRRLQTGDAPLDYKPMRTIGAGVAEIRVHGQVEHRVVYIAKFEEAIYVLHAFEKRSQKTSRRDLQIATQRFANLVQQRKRFTR